MDQVAEKARQLARHAARLRAGARHGSRQAPFDLALFTDERAGDPVEILAQLPRLPLCRMAVIFRHYETTDREALGARLKHACRMRNTLFLVAGDAAMATRLGADGVHLPQWQIPRMRGLKCMQPDWILSAACHDEAALVQASFAGADCAFLSPVFTTQSHPGAQALGLLHASALRTRTNLPVLALGGITAKTVRQLPPGMFSGLGAINGLKP